MKPRGAMRQINEVFGKYFLSTTIETEHSKVDGQMPNVVIVKRAEESWLRANKRAAPDTFVALSFRS